MIKQYFKQALAQLRQHPLISVISIAGTALSIFLIMLVVMLQQVKVAPFSPESNRDRFLHVHYMSISHKDWGDGTSNGPMSVRTAREIYKSLKTPEAVTIYCSMPVSTPVSLPAMPAIGADVRETDDTFFKVFDFRFVNGKPYDEATFNAGTPVAVITESISAGFVWFHRICGQRVFVESCSLSCGRGSERCIYSCRCFLWPSMDSLYFDGFA